MLLGGLKGFLRSGRTGAAFDIPPKLDKRHFQMLQVGDDVRVLDRTHRPEPDHGAAQLVPYARNDGAVFFIEMPRVGAGLPAAAAR